MLAVGANGAGKTNLLEAIHVGSQGFSPRTRSDAELIRFGAPASRVVVRGERGGLPVEAAVTLRLREGKRASLNGAALPAAEQLRTRLSALVFTPDRLAIVKGGPAVRRAYFDRTLGRLAPARAGLPGAYASALGQRNAALRRIAAGVSSRDAITPWTETVADLGGQLFDARRDMLALIEHGFGARAEELGLPDARLRYEGEAPTRDSLESRLERDIERGFTGAGPHVHDVAILSAARDLRLFGSQGEQRLAVLALLLSEAELVAERSGAPPLLLLDDVLSELDGARRRALADRVLGLGQTLITATAASALPVEPAQVIEVAPGRARPA